MSAWTEFRDSIKGEVKTAAESAGFGSATDAGSTVASAAPSIFKGLFGPSPQTGGNVAGASTNIVPPILMESAAKYRTYLILGGTLVAAYLMLRRK